MNYAHYRTLITMAVGLMWCSYLSASLYGADTFGYTVTSNVPFSYVDIAATGTSVLAHEDDRTAVLNLPFGFRFYGTTYTDLCVSTNGVLTFSGCAAEDITNLDLTAQSPSGNLPLIAPFWMDLTFAVPGSGSILYQTLGAAPSRRFVIQWNDAFALNQPAALNFQVLLFEGSNNILFQYRTVETSSPAVTKGAGATVGIRGSSGQSTGNRIQWSLRTPVLSNHTALQFTPPPTAIMVKVDLKPESNPNCVNPRSNGTVPVAIFGTSTFQVSTINQSTLRFGGASARHCAAEDVPSESSTGIFKKDGIPDLVCHFETEEVAWPAPGADCGRINLTGSLRSGLAITGSDMACRVAETTCKSGKPIPVP